MPVVEFVRPDGAAAVCGFIQPGHTMISVNDKTLLGMSLAEAARHIGECAQKTKDSNGTIPCTVRFLKTAVPPVSGPGEEKRPVSVASNGSKPTPKGDELTRNSPKPDGEPKGAATASSASATVAAKGGKQSGGCCFPKKSKGPAAAALSPEPKSGKI